MKTLLYLSIIVFFNGTSKIFAQTVKGSTHTDTQSEQYSFTSDTVPDTAGKPLRFSLSIGAGRAYGLGGCMLSLDFSERLGIDLAIGNKRIATLSARYNFPSNNTNFMTFSKISFYAQFSQGAQKHLRPGGAGSATVRYYFTEHFFIDNSLGLECTLEPYKYSDIHPWLHSGLGAGYTFGKNPYYQQLSAGNHLKGSVGTVLLSLIHTIPIIFGYFMYVYAYD